MFTAVQGEFRSLAGIAREAKNGVGKGVAMTLGTIAERVEHVLRDTGDHLDSEKVDHKIIYRVAVGKQLFTVTCEEMPPDRVEPAV